MKSHAADLGEIARHEIALKPGGETKLVVDLLHHEFDRVIATAKMTDLGAEGIEFRLQELDLALDLRVSGYFYPFFGYVSHLLVIFGKK